MTRKPLGRKAYGSIPHLPNSRLGPGDHSITPGQAKILTEKARDRHDVIIVTEKVDGSNCAVAKLDDGAICDVLVENGLAKSRIHAVEMDPGRRAILERKGYTVVADDFLKYSTHRYPFIIMNPPFEYGQDMDHITHAFVHCLALGGELVSVTSNGPFFTNTKKAGTFRGLVKANGYSIKLPDGSFKESGTNVQTRLVYLKRTF